MNIFENIKNFGAIDAENDEQLFDTFYRSNIIDRLYNYEKSIIIGRKGTGKTAIYKYIAEEKKEESISLLFRDYPWKLHDKFINKDVSARESYINSWTFLFYIEIFKKITANIQKFNNKKTKKELKKLKKWLIKSWGRSDFDHKETLDFKREIVKFIFEPKVFGISLGSIQKEILSADNYGGSLSSFIRKFENIISKLIIEFPNEIILLFDELDLSYTANDTEYKNRLIGLLIASYNFYSKYKKNIKIYLFLRNDIFHLLDFQDKNKIKDNMVEFLDWDGSSASKLSLKELISNRIKKNIDSKSDNFERNWLELFDSNNIGRNQLKWNFILERTFIRPRDIIKFMNLTLESTKIRLNKDPNSIDKITNEDMHSVKNEYSTYLYEELKDEVTSKYINFNNYLEILREIHTLTFSYEDFKIKYNSIKIRYDLMTSIDEVLERLYEFGIIGFYKAGGGGYGGSEYLFQYTSDYQAFNPSAGKFKVHEGFKEYLELKK